MITVILGNGFDLSLGFETGYSHYLSSDFYRQFRAKCSLIPTYIDKNTKHGWYDIESTLAEVSSKTVDGGKLLVEYNLLVKSVQEYIAKIANSSTQVVTSVHEDFLKKTSIDRCKVYSFNYTNTAELLRRYNANVETFYLHGTHDKRIIFGVGDHNGTKNEHSFLFKSTSDMFNPQSFKSSVLNSQTIYIFGHSLGPSDYYYFQQFFDSNPSVINGKHIIIYTKDINSKNDIDSNILKMLSSQLSHYKSHNALEFVFS